jgi:DNA-binding NarL/FixJ family response regulator
VFEAGDGLEAVHELRKRHFEVVISDYRMPRFDGMQLLTMCQLFWPETAVVLVSGEDSGWIELARGQKGSPCLGEKALRTA